MSAMSHALKLLAKRDYSKAEMIEKLTQAGFDQSDVEDAVLRLSEYGYLDDEKFTTSFIETRIKQKVVSKQLLEEELRRRKIDENIIKAAVDHINDEDLLQRTIKNYLRLKGNPKNLKEVKKLYSYLLRHGFSEEMILESFHKFKISIDDA
jgi:regulatory protein